jgi:hypothetical protein
VDHLFPIICSFFLGSWSDTFGRKLLLYIYFVFRGITDDNMRKTDLEKKKLFTTKGGGGHLLE